MTRDNREQSLTETFVTLADTLVMGYDVVELLQTLVDTCAELLDADAAGIMLADARGQLALVAATSEESRLVEMIQISSGDGPCVECFNTGLSVSVPDVDQIGDKWPGFRDEAVARGFHSVHGVPLRLRASVIGTMNLFRTSTGVLSDEDLGVAQALADVATIGILQQRAISEADTARSQLQSALDSRVLIEQAKGVIAHTRDVDMDVAFSALRDHARSNHLTLHDVATKVVERSISL